MARKRTLEELIRELYEIAEDAWYEQLYYHVNLFADEIRIQLLDRVEANAPGHTPKAYGKALDKALNKLYDDDVLPDTKAIQDKLEDEFKTSFRYMTNKKNKEIRKILKNMEGLMYWEYQNAMDALRKNLR